MDVWYATTLWLALLSGWIDPASGRRGKASGAAVVQPVNPPALLVPPSGDDGSFTDDNFALNSLPDDPAGGGQRSWRSARNTRNADYYGNGKSRKASSRSSSSRLSAHGGGAPSGRGPKAYTIPTSSNDNSPDGAGGMQLQTMPLQFGNIGSMFGGGGSGGGGKGKGPQSYNPRSYKPTSQVLGKGGESGGGGGIANMPMEQVPAIALFPQQGQRPESLQNLLGGIAGGNENNLQPFQQSGQVWDDIWSGNAKQSGKIGNQGKGMPPLGQQEEPRSRSSGQQVVTNAFPDMGPFASLMPYKNASPPRRRHGKWSTTAMVEAPAVAFSSDSEEYLKTRLKRKSKSRRHPSKDQSSSMEESEEVTSPPKKAVLPTHPPKVTAKESDEAPRAPSKSKHRGPTKSLHVAARVMSASNEEDESEEPPKEKRNSRRLGGKKVTDAKKVKASEDEDEEEEEDKPSKPAHRRRLKPAAAPAKSEPDSAASSSSSSGKKHRRPRKSETAKYTDDADAK